VPLFLLCQSLPLLQLTRLVWRQWPHLANASSVPSVRGPGCLLDTRPVTVAGKALADRGADDAFDGNIFRSLQLCQRMGSVRCPLSARSLRLHRACRGGSASFRRESCRSTRTGREAVPTVVSYCSPLRRMAGAATAAAGFYLACHHLGHLFSVCLTSTRVVCLL
jgi:hypothetical protein